MKSRKNYPFSSLKTKTSYHLEPSDSGDVIFKGALGQTVIATIVESKGKVEEERRHVTSEKESWVLGDTPEVQRTNGDKAKLC